MRPQRGTETIARRTAPRARKQGGHLGYGSHRAKEAKIEPKASPALEDRFEGWRRGGQFQRFTKDVSAGSFCAELMRVPSPGTQVRGSIVIGGNAYAFSGKVAWARASEPRMNLRGSIGMTFNEIADALKERLT